MAIRNAMLRMSGRDVGGWDDEVNPERLRKEVVELLKAFLQNGLSRPRMPLRKSKRKLDSISVAVGE